MNLKENKNNKNKQKKPNSANNYNRNRFTEMEITWKVFSGEGEGGGTGWGGVEGWGENADNCN